MEAVLASPKDLLAARLEDPYVVDSLNRLLDQAPLLAFGAEALSGFIARGDAITENISAQFAELRENKSIQDSVHLAESIPQLLTTGGRLAATASTPAFNNLLNSGLIEELGKPETIASLKQLLGRLELVAFAVEAADGFIRRSDTILDSLGDSLKDATNLLPSEAAVSSTFHQIVRLAASAPRLMEVANRLLDAGLVDKLEQLANVGVQLLDSGLLDAPKVKTLAEMGTTMVETLQETKQKEAAHKLAKVGIFDLLGALRDPNIQASLGFILEFGKRYGEKIRVPKSA